MEGFMEVGEEALGSRSLLDYCGLATERPGKEHVFEAAVLLTESGMDGWRPREGVKLRAGPRLLRKLRLP
jgi:hypothetical protein